MRVALTCVIMLMGWMTHELEATPCDHVNTGSTKNLDLIFIGKCNYFVNVLHSKNCAIQSAQINCDEIWQEFSNAIIGKNPCDITSESFNRLMDMSSYPTAENSTLFWSGAKDMAQQMSKVSGFVSLENTLLGYIADELQFCSAQNQSWLTADCPDECVKWNNPFWNAASINLARHAAGKAVVVLNATQRRNGAISNRSTFMKYEVPNLVAGKLTELKVVLVSEPGEETFETCARPKTLVHLKNILREKNIRYSCQDYALDLIDSRLFICFRQPDINGCQQIINKAFEATLAQYRSMATSDSTIARFSALSLFFSFFFTILYL